MASVVPSEFDSMSTGARSGPSTWTLIGQPSASMTGMFPPPRGFRWLWTLAGAQLERADHPVDKGLGGTLIAHRLEQPGQLADVEMRLYPLVRGQHLLQLALGGGRPPARLLDDGSGLLLAELAGEREGHRFGHDLAARGAEIDAHA